VFQLGCHGNPDHLHCIQDCQYLTHQVCKFKMQSNTQFAAATIVTCGRDLEIPNAIEILLTVTLEKREGKYLDSMHQ